MNAAETPPRVAPDALDRIRAAISATDLAVKGVGRGHPARIALRDAQLALHDGRRAVERTLA